jgi:hypothetical protein
MKKWLTELRAIDPGTGELKTWCGPDIEAPTATLAREYCDNNGLGYLTVIGELLVEIPCKEGTNEPDWDNMVDYEKEQLN